ncbi:MAG: hypothetical protein WC061_05275 [Melioribacteraceae bacterium]
MRRLITIGLVAILFCASETKDILAQDSETGVKNTLNSLFNYSKSKQFDKASGLIAYNGADNNRNRKDSFNAANKDELGQVKRICKKISALIDLSSKQEFGKFEIKKDGTAENYLIEANFISGDQKLVTIFSFIKTEKGFLMTDIN